MIPKIRRGDRTRGLLAYLFGPGKHEEHTDAHLVGSWDGFAPDPGRDPNPDADTNATLSRLAAALDLRVKQAGDRAPAEHVWHCSVRTAPGDRTLSDQEWNAIAQRILHAVNIAPTGDPDGCRWVAVRHADDHIHILATMVRGDLRRPRMNFDKKQAQTECRAIEQEMGLRRLNAGDGTAPKNPTSAERFKAKRTGRTDTPRETLREGVRQALAGAASEEEFFTRLREAGLRVNLRNAPSGDVLGYTVALPGDRNANSEPVWFAGSTLAPDLSLPKIRRRLADGTTDEAVTSATATGRPGWSPSAQGRRTATGTAERAAILLASNDDAEAAAQLTGIGELLDALAQTSSATTRAELGAAARTFERATRSHIRAQHADNRAIRSAARGIIQAGSALGRGEDGGTTAMLLSTLVLVALAAARWHSAHGHAQQAEASRQTAEHLRAAYRQAATAPMKALRDHGRTMPEAERRTHETTIRSVLPEHHLATNAATDTDALAATLAQIEQAGHNPKALLQEAIDMRELNSADDVHDVLIWRLRRLAQLPAYPGETTPRRQPSTSRKPSTSEAARYVPSPTTANPSPTEPRHRSSRR